MGRAPSSILMTTDTLGGVWSYTVELARPLTEAGCRVFIAALGGELTEAQRRQVEGVDGLEVACRPYRLEWMDDPWDEVEAACRWLQGVVDANDFDLVHLNTLGHGAVDYGAPVVAVGHSCVLSWFEAVRGEAAPRSWARYKEVVGQTLRRSDVVVAPSFAMLRALERHYGPLGITKVVYNARDPRDYAAGDKEDVVLAAGRLWDEAKNVAALARIADRLPWPVVLAGSAHHPDGGQVEFDGVRCLGQLAGQELAAWYGRSRIYALPARYEPFGLTALEAALAGNALVLGDIASLREVWGEAAIFVDPDDERQLAAVLAELVADDGQRREMAARARERALTYSPERKINAYLQLYGALLSSGRLEEAGPTSGGVPCAS